MSKRRRTPQCAGGGKLAFVDREAPFGAGTEPIVLHRDAVSGGGYFMLGTVISADMDLIGQLQPHMETRFVSVDMDQALAARAERNALIGQMHESLG